MLEICDIATIELDINGEKRMVAVRGAETLLYTLREQFGLTGAKMGCESGDCEARTVLVDGWPIKSCLMLSVEAVGHSVTTIEGVVLAAGLSKRTGTCKMLLDMGGVTLVERCIRGMYDVCSKIIVVGGHNFDNIARIIVKYDKVKMVYNPNYLEGMFSSVKEGFKNVSGDRFFFTPGDYPLINCDTYNKMLEIEGDIIIPIFCGEQGHPILIKTSIAKELIHNMKYSTLREFIDDKDYITIEVGDPGILIDIDTMDDYKKIMESKWGKHKVF